MILLAHEHSGMCLYEADDPDSIVMSRRTRQGSSIRLNNSVRPNTQTAEGTSKQSLGDDGRVGNDQPSSTCSGFMTGNIARKQQVGRRDVRNRRLQQLRWPLGKLIRASSLAHEIV